MNFLRTIIAVLAFVLPSVVFAGIGDSSIKTWNTPAPDSTYGYNANVVYQGTVQIPTDWMGRVRIFADGTNIPSIDQVFFNFNQATTTYTFNANSGTWASGAHKAEVRFDGAQKCRVNSPCTDQDVSCHDLVNTDTDPNNDWCPQSTENQVLDQRYPTRNVTVGPPPEPVLSISVNPLDFYNQQVGGATVQQTITLTNIGAPGTLVVGNGTRVTGTMYTCVSGCTGYSIAPGSSQDVTLAFSPPATVGSWPGSFQFSCDGCTGQGLGQTLTLAGATIAGAAPAKIRLDSSSLNFGTVNIGAKGTRSIDITNSGGTPMVGKITFSNAQTTCSGTCNFSLNSGQTVTRTLMFTPTIAGALSGATAIFTASSGGAPQVTIPLSGIGNDKPILNVYSGTIGSNVSDGDTITVTTINQGQTGIIPFDVSNIGAGVMTADTTGLPSADGVFTCDNANGNCGVIANIQSVDTGGAYKTVNVVASPLDANTHSVLLTFRDKSPGATKVIRVTVKIVPNAAPLARMNGGYPCTLNFGNVLVGNSTLPLPDPDPSDGFSQQTQCQIQNVGIGQLRVTLPNFSRNGTGRYDCENGPGLSCGTFLLGPGQTGTFKYRFTALAADPDILAHDWNPVAAVPGFEGFPNGDELHFHAAPMSIDLSQTPSSTPPYDFGTVNINQVSPTKTYALQVTHIGGQSSKYFSSPLPGSVTYSIQNSAHFICKANCGGTMKPYGSTQTKAAQVDFEPKTATGAISENVNITFNFGTWIPPVSSSPLSLTLTGVGNDQPVLDLTGDIVPPVIDFGNTQLNTTKTLNITLTNIGVGNLKADFDTFPAPFDCPPNGSCKNINLPTGKSKSVQMTFTPTTTDFYEKTVTLTSNGGNRTLTLRGTGKAAPVLSVTPTIINFDLFADGSAPIGPTFVGNVKSTTFRVTNSGLGVMSGSASLAAPTSHFLMPTRSFALNPGESIDIPVQFAPVKDSIPLSAQVLVTADDGFVGGWTGNQTIDLTGTGAFASLIDFRGSPPNFGPVVYGKYKEIQVPIRNAGVRPLGQGTFEFSAGSPFTCVSPLDPIDNKCHYDIGPNGETTITIRFTPTHIGAASADLSLSSLTDFFVTVTGTGVPPRFNYKEQ